MTPHTVLALALFGLVGGTHCVAMCGPLAGLFSSRLEARGLRRVLALGTFHGGRLGAYALLGVVASMWGAAGLSVWPPLGAGIRVLAAGLVVLYGLRFAGVLTPGSSGTSRSPLGALVGGPVRRALGGLLPLSSLPRAFGAGALWALIPCGLVYSALAICASVGEPASGALGMLAFGLGALPWLLFVDVLAGFAKRLAARPWARRTAGVVVVSLGVAGGIEGARSLRHDGACHATGEATTLETVVTAVKGVQ